MNIYAIVAHDKKDSVTHTIFMHTVEHLRANGATVDVLDLYERATEIPFYTHDKSALEKNAFFLENKERFMKADRLFIQFPVYWYSTPGILKCWFDLITSYAYRLEQGFYARPLHSIEKAFFVTSTMTPNWFNKFILNNPAQQQLKQTCKFIGIYNSYFYQIDNTRELSEKKIEAHKNYIYKMSLNLLS